MEDLLHAADRAVRPLQLNFFKKAKLANSFKWRLLERGIESETASELTQALVMHLSMSRISAARPKDSSPASLPSSAAKPQELLARAVALANSGAHLEAIETYQALLKINPRDAIALNGLGAACGRLARFSEAEPYLRSAIGIKSNYAEAHANLGAVLRAQGKLGASEHSLRRALKLSPGNPETLVSLGSTLLGLARIDDAKMQFEKALRLMPQHIGALLGMGQVANFEGRAEDAEAIYRQVLEKHPQVADSVAGLIGLRRMTSADGDLLRRAEELLKGQPTASDEINLRFAIGKFCDDTGEYERAFTNYQRANELMKQSAESYDREAHVRFVDDLVRVCTSESMAAAAPGSESTRPVFVIGMPRSGTSLVEQIIASHPAAAAVGEQNFWAIAMRKHEAAARQGILGVAVREKLATAYLSVLDQQSSAAQRVIDKTPANADYLGLIHTVFPRARIIYMQRHPIDACLSCYFQQFSAALNFTMDLSDLANYYRQHHRLVSHWRTVLPPGTMLDVPYEELVADQALWTRTILEFIGLDWDERCLSFNRTRRTVATASAWQVRQKLYTTSVARRRNYAKFLGPLRDLDELQHRQ